MYVADCVSLARFNLPSDAEMVELMKPSIEEAFVIQDQDVALDYIGMCCAMRVAARRAISF